MSLFLEDLIKAALSSPDFDTENANILSKDHRFDVTTMLKEIQILRNAFEKGITPEAIRRF